MKYCPRCRKTKPLEDFYSVHGYCKPCHRTYNRNHARANPQGSTRLRMKPEEKDRVTETAIAASFSDEHARAMHRIAFMPEFATEEDLQMWTEVVAGMVLQSN